MHAKLGPSSSSRWLHCTPSIMMELRMPERAETDAMREGTEAHAIAEAKLKKYLAKGRKKIECPNGEMNEATEDYKNYVVEIFNRENKKCGSAILLVEEQLDLSKWVPNSFGTSDAVIVGKDTVHIIDFKYGTGVPVSAKDNPQCKLYAAAAYEEYSLIYGIKHVVVHIFQPRIDLITEDEFNINELLGWMDDFVKPRALLADAGEGGCNAGDHCVFCRAKPKCKAHLQMVKEMDERYKRIDSMLMSNQEVADVLTWGDSFVKWINAVSDFALDEALKGESYEGFKVVEGTSRRKIMDEKLLVENMNKQGFKEAELYERKILGITALEKLAGKKIFTVAAAGCVDKPAGKPTLVPISDKRPEYNAGSSDFADELEAT